MKAWHLFLFVYAFQLLLGTIAPYYIQNYANNTYVVDTNALGNMTDPSVITTENQYLATAQYYGVEAKSKLEFLLTGLMPLGSFLESLFPDLLPSGLIFLLNSIWGIIFGLTVLEFMRGFKIFGD